MKKFLLSLFGLFSLLSTVQLKAQCDLAINNLVTTIVGTPSIITSTQCEYKFNMEFDITTNSGFKYLFFHSWRAADYPSPAIFNCNNSNATDPGTSTQLGTAVDDVGKSFLDIGFLNLNSITFPVGTPVNVTSYIANTYLHDNTVVLTKPSNSPSLTAVITRTSSNVLHFVVSNIKIIVNQPCGTLLNIKTDIWGSNSNAPDPKAQCYICGINQSINFTTVALSKTCSSAPFQYSISISTQSPTDIHLVYKIYAEDQDGIKEPGTDDPLLFTSSTITLNSSTSPYNSGPVNLPFPYCCVGPWSNWGIFAEVTATEFTNSIGTNIMEPACSPLPVKLNGFDARRFGKDVVLTWNTSTEENNKGFEIERANGTGMWQKIGFVPSQAVNGSDGAHAYKFTDFNNVLKGISQYRLKQIDIDYRSTYSPIRSVLGENQIAKTIIYPNPSVDGTVNLVFEEGEGIRNVTLMDINGRTIKQWKGVTNNNIRMDNLQAGFYSVRIVNTETNEQVVEKFVVNKR